ncbi:MAG: family 78 glycoside hydrolase catalytic domain, partial [Planctomycetota bacterium]
MTLPTIPHLQHFPRNRRWQAHWIWQGAATANAHRLVRRVFHLDRVGAELRLLVSAAAHYRLYVNGSWMADGPVPSAAHHQYYDIHDCAAMLQPGDNCIAAIVWTGHEGPAGFLAELLDGERSPLGSDGSWRCWDPAAWRPDSHAAKGNVLHPYQEQLDARRLPVGWTMPAWPDADLPRAQIIAGRLGDRPPQVWPWQNLLPADIPALAYTAVQATAVVAEEECLSLANRWRPQDLSISLSQCGSALRHARIEQAASLCSSAADCTLQRALPRYRSADTAAWDPCLLLDFGRILTAHIELEVDAEEGAVLEIGSAERLIDGHFNNAIECPFAESYTTRSGAQSWRSLAWRSFRYLRIRLRDGNGPMRIRALHALRVRSPLEDVGAFASSDDRLCAVERISRETIRLCSVAALMDTPHRESAQWLGDVAAVTVPGLHACFGDTHLAGKFLRQAAMNSTPGGLLCNLSNNEPRAGEWTIPDYSLWWL